MIPRWIHGDRIAKPEADAGFLVILRDRNGEALQSRYISRANWDTKGSEALWSAFHKPLLEPYSGPLTPGALTRYALTNFEPMEPSLRAMDPQELVNLTPTSFLLFDLRAIFEDAQNRIEKFCERASPALSVEDLLDAFTVASQVRDQVDSIEDEIEK